MGLAFRNAGIPGRNTSLKKASFLFLSVTNCFSTIHPKTTMKTLIFSIFHLFPRNINYITSWLSIVGPVVGLNLPLSYAIATSQDEWNVHWQGKKKSLDFMFCCWKDSGASLALRYILLSGKFVFIFNGINTGLFFSFPTMPLPSCLGSILLSRK